MSASPATGLATVYIAEKVRRTSGERPVRRIRLAGQNRSWRVLLTLGMLAGLFAAPITSAVLPAVAGADAGAVVPDSAISGFTPVALPGTDDGSTGSVPLGFNIDFYGQEYGSVYVNNNGNLTFNSPLSTYTPFGLTSTNTPIIAPFFADVDTRVGNTVEYGTGTLDGHSVFVANWPGVGCYNQNDTVTDDFQAILIDRSDRGTGPQGDDFDVEFNYNTIQWDAGQASGGNAECTDAPDSNSAAVGFSNGTATPGDSSELAGSQTSGAFLDFNPTTGLINNDFNSDVLGQYLFSITGGQPRIAYHLVRDAFLGTRPTHHDVYSYDERCDGAARRLQRGIRGRSGYEWDDRLALRPRDHLAHLCDPRNLYGRGDGYRHVRSHRACHLVGYRDRNCTSSTKCWRDAGDRCWDLRDFGRVRVPARRRHHQLSVGVGRSGVFGPDSRQRRHHPA